MSSVLAPPSDVERVLQLKTMRDPGARAQVVASIRELGRDGGEFTLQRLQRLISVDEHFHAVLASDQPEFLQRPPPMSEVDRDFALNVQRVCLESANAFQRFLRNRAAWATSREALETMFRVTGLAINAIHGFVKWGYFLNEPGRAVPWKQLHALFSLAEADGYSQVPFSLHASQPGFKPSVQSLYLRTLILDMLNTGNLSRMQLEIADAWFAAWCADYSIDTEFSSRQHVFYVDLASDSGLHLLRRDSHGESMRYIRAENLKAQIEDMQGGLRQGRLYGGSGGAAALLPIEEHVALLAVIEKLYHSVLAGSESRVDERTHFDDREVDVVTGIDRVLAKVHGMEEAESGLERWRVHDLSTKGYGLVVDRATAETILLAGLVALRNQSGAGWILCTVVRKLANRVRGEMLIGLEVLSYRPVPVYLTSNEGRDSAMALFLPGTDPNGKLDSLLVHARDFNAGSTAAIEANGARYNVRMNRIIRKGADWIKARFEIASKT
jgi:hypothetical protein